MSWNYRVRKTREGFDIVEVHYNKTGTVKFWSKGSQFPYGGSADELRDDLYKMLQALDSPILEDNLNE